MTLAEILAIIFPAGQPKRPTPEQEDILRHPQGPGWVLAGPGSGKTEVLTLLVLRLLYVENDATQIARVPPESIFITTFTEKAARNLEDLVDIKSATACCSATSATDCWRERHALIVKEAQMSCREQERSRSRAGQARMTLKTVPHQVPQVV